MMRVDFPSTFTLSTKWECNLYDYEGIFTPPLRLLSCCVNPATIQMQVVNVIATCTLHPDTEIAALTFKFWGELGESVGCATSSFCVRAIVLFAGTAPRELLPERT